MAHGHKNSAHPAPGATHEAVPLDPEHDIDAKSAAVWFIGSAVVLFVSLWLLVPIFQHVLEAERERKIYSAPNTEREAVVNAERKFLDGANPTKKSIQSVVKQLSGK